MKPYVNRFTGIFREIAPIPAYAHDPEIFFHGGVLARGRRGDETGRNVGGAGFSPAEAELSCLGEGIERFELSPPVGSESVLGSFESFPIPGESPLEPGLWSIFSAAQYRQPGFPFEELGRDTLARHVCFRRVGDGEPVWVPEELSSVVPRSGGSHRFFPGTSTGLVAEMNPARLVLRGTEEWIERDGVIGAWWGVFEVEEWPADLVLKALAPGIAQKVVRPNLSYRFFRVCSPYSVNVTIVFTEGRDLKTTIRSFGSACREALIQSFEKSLLESIQTRIYVRALLEAPPDEASRRGEPSDFGGHAAYYSRFSERLPGTLFPRLRELSRGAAAELLSRKDVPWETLEEYAGRLGARRPILFRLSSMSWAPASSHRWYVARVLIPGLLILHGDERFPALGPLSALAEASDVPAPLRLDLPHPFA